jgi:23S rRNA (adenine2030-N6)-methyltransferase
MIIVNPPFTLEKELAVMLPALHAVLAESRGAGWRIERLTAEDANV